MTFSAEIDHSDHPPAIVSSERVERQERGDPYSSEASEELLTKPTKTPKPNYNENHEQVRGDPYYSDILEWLQDFKENLVDDCNEFFFHQLDVLSQRRCVDESAKDQKTRTVLDDKRLKADTCADCCNLTEH